MRFRPLETGCLTAAILALSACSSGTSTPGADGAAATDTPPASTAVETPKAVTLSGVAASGAPIANAVVVLTDATGNTVTATATADGAYTIDATGLTAPFVVVATGIVGEGQATLVSMHPSATSATVNITPITNAIAATLAPGGDPLALAANPARVTESAVAASEQALRLVLAPMMTAAGASGSLINAVFTADGTGLDKLLDQVKVDVKPGGLVEMSTLAGEGAATPVALVFDATATLPTAADAAKLPAPAAGDDVVGASTFAPLRAALARCFAGTTPASRNDVASPCGGIVIDDETDPSMASNPYVRQAALLPAYAGMTYLHEADDADASIGALAADAGMNDARFGTPQIVRQVAPDAFALSLPYVRTDGATGTIETVARKVLSGATATDSAWRLTGNQRNVSIQLRAAAQRWAAVNTTATAGGTSAYHTGLILSVSTTKGLGPTIQWAKVTGPGLDPAGMVLKPSTGAGCTALTLTSQKGDTTRNRANCSQFVRLAGAAIDPAVTTYNPFNGAGAVIAAGQPFAGDAVVPNYVVTPASDDLLKSLTPGTEYTLTVKLSSQATPIVLRERLRSRPLAVSEVAKLKWNDLTPDTLTALRGFAGGPSFTAAWTAQPGALPVIGVGLQVWNGTAFTTQNASFRPGRTSTALTRAGGASFPAVSGANTSATAGGTYLGLTSRDQYGMNVKSDTTLYY